MNKLLFLIFILTSNFTFAQNKSGYTQVFGLQGIYARFDGTSSIPITGQLFSNNPMYVFSKGHSNICDSASGKLLMLCNGYILYDTTGVIMENGDSLFPHNIYNHYTYPACRTTQGSLIIPKGSANFFYVFTPTITDSSYSYWINNPLGDGRLPFDLLQYHIVDMNANGGLGKVVQKNIPLLMNTEMFKVGMMACRHANGYDWWLLKQGAPENKIYTFLVTKDTVQLDTIQSFSAPVYNSYYDLRGQSCFSSKGDKYAFATNAPNGGAKLFISDFDRCYGIVRNVKEILVPHDSSYTPLDNVFGPLFDSTINGVCFSPNDSFLYITRRYTIYQYDLFESDTSLAMKLIKQGTDTTFDVFSDYGQLYKGIDNKIYIGKFDDGTSQNSVINKPNLKGAACDFCKKCLRYDMSGWPTNSFPNMPDFNLGAMATPCAPLSQGENGDPSKHEWSCYPNPANNTLYFKNATNQQKQLLNIYGQVLFTTKKEEMDISWLPSGIYFVRCGSVVKKVLIQ
jgi:hypothetical protein